MVIEDEHGERWVVDEGGRVSNGGGNNGNTSDGSIETDRTNVVNYTLPLTIYLDDDYYLIDPDKTEFSSGDTITIQSYMAGIEFFVKDAQNQSIELLPSYFPDNSGYLWPPGFILDIEDLEYDFAMGFEIQIPEVDNVLVHVIKVPLPSDVPNFDINQNDIEDITDDCTDWSENSNVSYTCNFCVRDAFYRITGSTILYPGSPNNICVCCDPDETNLTGGLVDGNGTANTIYNTLVDEDSDLAQYFKEISDMEGEDYPDFTQMQLDADNGQLIVGVKKCKHRPYRFAHAGRLMGS